MGSVPRIIENEEIWELNHFPRHWLGNIVKDTINQLRRKEKRKGYIAGVAIKQQKTKKQQFALQYRDNIFNEFVEKLNKIHPVQTTLITGGLPKSCLLKSCLANLKSSFDKDLKSHVVYELNYNGCRSNCVGQTCRHITTRVAEHAKADSPMGIHTIECNGHKTAFQWKILDQCCNQSKLLALEALNKRTLKPTINTRYEYRTQELTLKA